jgi:hypothetical protein
MGTPEEKREYQDQARRRYRQTHGADGHALGSAAYPNNREGRRALAKSWRHR